MDAKANGNFPYQLWTAPGVFSRCDRQATCVPFHTKRVQHSLDWLCCEDAKGWVAIHIITPMLLRMFLSNFWYAWFGAFLFEIVECVMLVAFHSFGFTETLDLALETLPGSILGDAFINGFIGAFLGQLIVMITGFITPWSRVGPMQKTPQLRWLITKYLALFAMLGATTTLVGLGGYEGSDPYLGVQIAVPVMIILYWTVFRWATSTETDLRVVWGSRENLRRRDNAFLYWTVLSLLVFSQSSGLIYAANDWYQVWLIGFFLIISLCFIWKHN